MDPHTKHALMNPQSKREILRLIEAWQRELAVFLELSTWTNHPDEFTVNELQARIMGAHLVLGLTDAA